MTKKWRKRIVVSMIILFLEVVASVVILFPYYHMQRLFDSIDAGQWTKTAEYFADLSESQKEQALSYLDDYGAYLCQRYIDGEITYEQVAASFDAINSIDESHQVFEKYIPELNRNEYKYTVTEMMNAMLRFDMETRMEMNRRLYSLEKRMDNKDKETVLIEILNENYSRYLREEIDYVNFMDFASTVSDLSYYDAYQYAEVLKKNAEYVSSYRSKYPTIETMLQNEDYFGVIDLYRSLILDPEDTIYQERFDQIYSAAYEAGKESYRQQLQAFLDSEDKEGAVNLMAEIEAHYGEDFDLSFAKDALTSDWQDSYLILLKDWESDLRRQLADFETGQYILENKFDELKPDSLVLYDVNSDDIPELFLFNSSQVENDYVGCFIYGYNEETGNYRFLNFVNVMYFCSDSTIIASPIAFTRTVGEEYVLMQYDGSSIYEGSSCQNIGGTYYANYAETDNVGFLSARTSILSHQNEWKISNSGYTSLRDSESYILAY